MWVIVRVMLSLKRVWRIFALIQRQSVCASKCVDENMWISLKNNIIVGLLARHGIHKLSKNLHMMCCNRTVFSTSPEFLSGSVSKK